MPTLKDVSKLMTALRDNPITRKFSQTGNQLDLPIDYDEIPAVEELAKEMKEVMGQKSPFFVSAFNDVHPAMKDRFGNVYPWYHGGNSDIKAFNPEYSPSGAIAAFAGRNPAIGATYIRGVKRFPKSDDKYGENFENAIASAIKNGEHIRMPSGNMFDGYYDIPYPTNYDDILFELRYKDVNENVKLLDDLYTSGSAIDTKNLIKSPVSDRFLEMNRDVLAKYVPDINNQSTAYGALRGNIYPLFIATNKPYDIYATRRASTWKDSADMRVAHKDTNESSKIITATKRAEYKKRLNDHMNLLKEAGYTREQILRSLHDYYDDPYLKSPDALYNTVGRNLGYEKLQNEKLAITDAIAKVIFRDNPSYDSVIWHGTKDGGTSMARTPVGDVIAVRDNNKIKHAMDNIGTFNLRKDAILRTVAPYAGIGTLAAAMSNPDEAYAWPTDAPVEDAWNPVEALVTAPIGAGKAMYAAGNFVTDALLSALLAHTGGHIPDYEADYPQELYTASMPH